ncbi:hypothetical protein K2F54_10335 [Cryobacterium sp. 1639]|uniref:hypothetical protein n=1 Tax=Cryobacterium inferilacus TaxID=2866629 RepID=UPI001C73D30A|nr:hypothetical protein [Cryobacterium sp. 1639]MBX0300372.1 hypothetical protein [Cryobacterium sp. 1639]
MRRSTVGALTLQVACAVLLAGCATPGASTDPFGCGIVVTPERAVVGGDVTVSRPAAEPSDICTTLDPGSTQTLEIRSSISDDPIRGTATAVVEDDGSFEVTMPVPTGIRLDRAVVTAIPPAESDCTEAAAAAGTPDDCYFPRAQFTVGFADDDLAPVTIVSTDAAQPPHPPGDGFPDSYALAGPGRNELTLVIFGSGCASRPTRYLHDAPTGSLEIVSEVIMPAGQNGCNEPLIPWTTVIEVPDEYRDYRSVKVDNLDAILLG